MFFISGNFLSWIKTAGNVELKFSWSSLLDARQDNITSLFPIKGPSRLITVHPFSDTLTTKLCISSIPQVDLVLGSAVPELCQPGSLHAGLFQLAPNLGL